MRARWLVLSLVMLSAAAPRAFAQSASVQAQSLFDEGRRLLKEGKIAEACAAFESSQKLDPAVTTLLNLADCREQNHQLATAWGTFVDANRMARSSNNTKLAGVANSHAHKLEPRLSKLTINVPADHQVPGLEVLRDNEPVNSAGWNHALPIDGGTYTITARAPGRAPWSTSKTIKIESDAQSVEIPKLAEAKPAAPVAAAPAGPAPASGRPATSPPAAISTGHPPDSGAVSPSGRPASPSVAAANTASPKDTLPSSPASPTSGLARDQPGAGPSRTLPLVVGAGALVLGGAAFGIHLWADRTYDDAKKEMGDQAKRDALEHSANTRGYIAQGVGIAAIGCAGVAVYLYIRNRGEGRADATAMTPVASPQFAGVAVVGRW
jgi:hypothetical protein